MNNTMIVSLLVAVFVSVTILLGIKIPKVKKVSVLSAIVTMLGCTISILGNSELGYFLFLLIPSLTVSFYIAYIYIKMIGKKARRTCGIVISIIAIIMIGMISFPFYVHLSDLDIKIGKNSIQIGGLYETEIKYRDVDKLEICKEYPNVSLRTNGFSFMGTHLGYFRTVEGRNIMLQIHSLSPCIHIKINNKDIFLNSKEDRKTKEIHKSISVAISAYKNNR